MAKQSNLQKNQRRKELVEFYAERRRELTDIIKDPEAEPDTSVHSLRRLYGLTATEAAFVAAFVEETSLKGTAARLSLTMSSARTYMKRIFLKTEVNSQAALMKLVLTGSAMPTLR